jgi:phage terminase large subunit-like protein
MRCRESRRLFEAMWSPDRLHDVLAVPVARRDDCLDHLATGLSERRSTSFAVTGRHQAVRLSR